MPVPETATDNGHRPGAAVGPSQSPPESPRGDQAGAVRDGSPDDPVAVAMRALRRNALLNVVVRALLGMSALAAAGLAIAYTAGGSGDIVDTLTTGSSGEPFAVRLISLTLPALLLATLGALCAGAAWLLYSRGRDDLEHGLDGVARLQREAEVAITARGLTHVFEEKLATAHRAFSLQLWLGRTLFIVSLTLFFGAIVQGLASGVSLPTLALGTGSLLSALYGTARVVPQRIACHLADVLQMQCAVTGCIRQISLLEAEAYALLSKHMEDPESVTESVVRLQLAIDGAVEATVVRIERYADPTGAGRRNEA